MKISINNPCHENWDAMTPNEKGAFCLSCQKNVVDFSRKTVSEIKDFFKHVPEAESVCGRFEEGQLDEMTFDHFHSQFKKWAFFQKAAVIIFFVFGFSLFGCAQNRPDTHIKMGTVAYMPEDTVRPIYKKDTIKTTLRPIKGKVKVVQEKPKKQKKEPPPQHLMGDVMIEDNKR